MPKRRAGSSLTGGTGDVNPQWMTLNVTQGAADNTTTTGFALPVPRYPMQNGKSIVMEIIKVQWSMSPLAMKTADVPAASAFFGLLQNALISTSNLAPLTTTTLASITQGLANPRVISHYQKEAGVIAVGAPSGTAQMWVLSANDEPVFMDLTDGAGHGFLVGTDTIYITILTGTKAGATFESGQSNNALCRLLYRFKEIDLAEYVGIVQSQQ